MSEKLMLVFKPKKWEYIPVIGVMIYLVRLNLYKNELEDKKEFKRIFHYSHLFKTVLTLISLPFGITFLVMTFAYGAPKMHWSFWISLSIGIILNGNVLVYDWLNKLSFKHQKRK